MIFIFFHTIKKSRLTMLLNATVTRTGSGLVPNCFAFDMNYAELSARGIMSFFSLGKTLTVYFLPGEKVLQERTLVRFWKLWKLVGLFLYVF